MLTSPPNGRLTHDRVPWPCWVEVDLDAVQTNVRTLVAAVGRDVGLLAVVKAQAYGMGAGPVAEAAVSGGAIGVAVARVCEGVQLRERGLESRIVLLGPIGQGEEDEVVSWGLTATLTDVDSTVRLAEAASRAGKLLPVQIKVDTGLTRFGARPEELLPLVRKVSSLAPLIPEGLYTHFAAADDPDPTYTRRQLSTFAEIRGLLSDEGLDFQVYHAANSAACLRYPDARLDWVRPGITLLGMTPSRTVPYLPGLQPAFRLKARVARVYDLAAGTSVGYGCTFQAPHDMRVALVPVGYADGVPRAHSNQAHVLIRGRRARAVGRVSMDQCMVDITAIGSVEPGDEVVLIGRQGDEEISLDGFAAWSDTIPHEALTRIGFRVPRVYLRDGHAESSASLNGEVPLPLPESVARW